MNIEPFECSCGGSLRITAGEIFYCPECGWIERHQRTLILEGTMNQCDIRRWLEKAPGVKVHKILPGFGRSEVHYSIPAIQTYEERRAVERFGVFC